MTGKRRRRADREREAVIAKTRGQSARSGDYQAAEWVQGKRGPRVRAVVIGNLNRNISGNPAMLIAHRIRAALDPHVSKNTSSQPITVYDATGKAIATIDPMTRERKPL